jgi:hypothetical protein
MAIVVDGSRKPVVEPGAYELMAGSSARDSAQQATLRVRRE